MEQPETSQRSVVLVTGAARGQGLAIVKQLIAKNYDVVACDVIPMELGDALPGVAEDRILVHPLDVTSEQSWADAIHRVEERFGRLDGLVNNAGILSRSSLSEETAANFERVWRVNCLGPFLALQACLPLLRRSPRAAVVNT